MTYLYPVLPRDREESIVFLNSIKGIGRKTAVAIIDQFGTIENALKNESVMVASIKSMTTTRVAYLKHTLAEITAVMDMVNLLSKTGVQNLTIAKIAEVYGVNSMNMVNNRPYEMLSHIPFKECDTIALSQGWDPKSTERIRAAILSAIMRNRAESVRIIMDGREAIDNALMYCNQSDNGAVSEADVREEMKKMVREELIVITNPYVYLWEDHEAEVNLAAKIVELSKLTPSDDDGGRFWAAFHKWKKLNPQICSNWWSWYW